ncbi:stage V sporulation protein B [Mechercharimyces sp. CAU 1602]|uniref:stage V sporulation protein B n=1 Tax=Mechercharimyces sp. CAU 1602 TaxID=2973933 RepID=UPI002163F950|nr:stage V sporulation protein B [Mechercharimyces sp. CAU 1602]MCS1350682.1 stage V sporulation protein B [Mechercharimyces sp. CAU 1602]
MSKQSFLRGTIILVGAGFITKVLGFVYRIALSRIIGDEGVGLFQMAFPILIFIIGLATAGLPVAISKLVSEAEATKNEDRIRSIILVSILIVTGTSITLTVCTILFAPIIAQTLLTDERAIYSLLGIAPIIPIVAISSVFRGYFQGRQHMSPYALSQIVEQVVRIFTVILFATYLLPYGVQYAAAGAMFGMVIGEGAGLWYLIHSYRKDPRRPPLRLHRRSGMTIRMQIHTLRETFRRLMRIALPVTTSRMVGSLAYAIEPIVVAQSLAIAGVATAASTALYGQLEGMAIPLVFFPAFITYALSVSLVPAVSEAAAHNQHRLIEHRLNQAIRLSLIVGGPCAVLLFVLAEPLTLLLYHHTEVGRLLKIMAPFAIFLYLQGPFSAVLQGLDRANEAMRNSIFGAIVKTILIFLLASQPRFGIDGVALAINSGLIIVTILHFFTILRYISLSIEARNLCKLTIALGLMGVTAHWLFISSQHSLLINVLVSITSSGLLYFILLILLSLLQYHDVIRIPYIGSYLAHFFPRGSR